MAIPSPMAVLPRASLAKIPSLYPALSLSLPPCSIRPVRQSIISSFDDAFTPRAILSGFKSSVIFILISSVQLLHSISVPFFLCSLRLSPAHNSDRSAFSESSASSLFRNCFPLYRPLRPSSFSSPMRPVLQKMPFRILLPFSSFRNFLYSRSKSPISLYKAFEYILLTPNHQKMP